MEKPQTRDINNLFTSDERDPGESKGKTVKGSQVQEVTGQVVLEEIRRVADRIQRDRGHPKGDNETVKIHVTHMSGKGGLVFVYLKSEIKEERKLFTQGPVNGVNRTETVLPHRNNGSHHFCVPTVHPTSTSEVGQREGPDPEHCLRTCLGT